LSDFKECSPALNFIVSSLVDLNDKLISKLSGDSTAVLIIETSNDHGLAEERRLFVELLQSNCNTPVIISRSYKNLSVEQLQLYSATDIGGLLIDGLGDGVFLKAENCAPDKIINETAFNISAGYAHSRIENRIHFLPFLRPHSFRSSGDDIENTFTHQSFERN